MTYEIHPVAGIFPLIEGEEFDALVADIKANGLLEPIAIIGNVIIDGRNRQRACEAAGVQPCYRELPDSTDPVRYITSKNIHRRQLTPRQCSAIAAEMATMGRGGNRGNQYTDGKVQNCTLPNNQITIEQAATLMNVSRRSVASAKKVMTEDPEAHEAAKRGEKQKRQKGDTAVQNTSDRRLWMKAAIKAFESVTGKMMGTEWIKNNVKPYLCEHAEWVADCHPNTNITEEQENEVKRLTIEFANQYKKETDHKSSEIQHASTIVTIDEAQAEAESIKNELDVTEETKLERAIKAHKKVLDIQFEQRVKQYLDEILPMYAAEYDRYKAFNDTYTGVFTDDEFRLLLSVLHPDRCQPERATQFSKAFHLIKSKEEVLCKVKPNERPFSLPSTLDELIAQRRRH